MGLQHKKTQKLLSIVACIIVMALPIQAMADGKALFKLKCITCHVLPDPDNLTADMWVPQMERMAVMATLSASQKTEILSYLQANSGTLEDILTKEKVHFDQHCSACHSTTKDVPTTANNGTQFEEYMIDHVEDKTGNDLEEEAAHEVAEYLLHSKIR
jgi:cytochrome c2